MTSHLALDAITARLARLSEVHTPAEIAHQLAALITAVGHATDRLPLASTTLLAVADQLTYASQALAEPNHDAARRHIMEAIKRVRQRTAQCG